MAEKVLLKNNNQNIIMPITRGELVLDSSGQLAFHSGQFLANEDRHGLMSNEDKINIKNIIEKTNNLDTDALNSAINSIKNAYLKSVNVNNTIVTITDQLDHETNFYNTIYTFESGTDGSFTVKENGTPSKITVGGTLTDEKVGQKNVTDNKEYRILLSNSDNDNDEVAPSNKSGKLLFNPSTGILTATAFNGKVTWGNIDNKPETFTPETHNHSTDQIFISNEYTKFEESESISSTDILTKALGKLEYKADLGKTAYDIVFAANNNNTIENLTEILKVLEGIKDTDTIQAIVNKYLPLSGGTMSGNINFGSDKGIYVNNSYAILALGSKGKFTGHPNDEESYTFVGTTNYNTIIRTKNKLQVYKNSNRYNIIDSSGGTISGSLTWEIPDYSVIPIIRNIKFTETTGWARKILAMQVDGVEQFSLGAYGYYNFPLNSENPNKADYLYLGFGGYNGNSLRVYPDGIKFGNETIWHSGNCNFLSSTNKNLIPAGSEITNAKIGELIGYQAINKSTWVYANNGYIKTEWGNMELAGSSILSFGTSSAYTQLFISAPSSSRGDGLINEMMFYNNHGSTYSPGWTRVVTNRNYTKIFGNPFKVNDQSYNIASDGSVSTGDIYLEMWRGDKASWKLINTGGTFKFLCNYTDKVVDYYDALTIGYNTGNIHTKGKIQINATSSYNDEKTLPDHAKLIIGNVTDGGTYGLYFSRSSILHMTNNKAVNNPLLINPLGGLVKIGDGGLESSSFIKANAFVLNGKDEDRNLIRINNTDGDINKKSYYGFNLKYLGSGAGNNNALALYADNQTATSQILSTKWLLDGTVTFYNSIYTGNIIPTETNKYDLGSNDYRWKTIYGIAGNFGIKDKTAGNTTAIADRLTLIPPGHTGGNWCIGIDDTSLSVSKLYFKYKNSTTTHANIAILSNNVITCNGNTVWHAGNDGSGSGLDADLLDGTHKSGLLTALTSSADTNLSITVGGTPKSVTDLLARHISPIINLNTNVTTKTVASVKAEIVSAFSNISYGIGSNVTVPAVAIANWDTDTTQLTASSVYSMIKIGGGYEGTQYGLWLLSTYNTSRIGIVGRSSNAWSSIKWIAFTDDAPTQIAIGVSSTSSYYPVPFVTSSGAGNKQLYIDSSTGTTNTSNGIRYNPSANTLYCSGGFYESSDERLKNIINPIKIDLDKLSKLRKVNFLWNSDPDKGIQLGVIAQDIQKLFPEIVTNCSEEGYLSIAYDKLSVIALAAIDKLYEENKKLNKLLKKLEKKLNNLKF